MSKWDDAFPLTDLADVRALRQEEDARTRELTDLPDTLTDEEAEALDSTWEQWLRDMAS